MAEDHEDKEFRGSLAQRALQRAVWARGWEVAETPGLFHGGRLIGVDDLAGLGDDVVLKIFEATGAVIVKFLDAAAEADFIARFEAPERRFTAWDVFMGGAAVRKAAARVVKGHKLSDGWRLSTLEAEAAPETITAIQAVQEASGVAPVPGYYQRGRAVPAVVSLLTDDAGAIIATAQAYQRHHAESPWAGHIFAGMVAVHPDHRRLGFGTLYQSAKTIIDGPNRVARWT